MTRDFQILCFVFETNVYLWIIIIIIIVIIIIIIIIITFILLKTNRFAES